MSNERSVMEQFRLENRRALITGGSKGLGRVIATAYAQAGADVVIVSRTAGECQTTATEIARSTGRMLVPLAADVTRSDEVERLFRQAGPIDILVNSAGVNIRKPIADMTEENWDEVLTVNLKAPFLMGKRFGPEMARRGWGRIIHLGSILSHISMPGRTPYASSKAGLLGLTRTLALEFASRGVTVNSLCPGPFATDMNRQLLNDPKLYAEFIAKLPIGRWGDLHEIAGPALFLASDASSFMTGSEIVVDGGWTAQ